MFMLIFLMTRYNRECLCSLIIFIGGGDNIHHDIGPISVNSPHHNQTVQGPGMNANPGMWTVSPFMESGPRNGQCSWSLPPGISYPHGMMNAVGPC